VAVELLLLLAPVDVELARVGGFARVGRAAVCLGLLDPQTRQVGFPAAAASRSRASASRAWADSIARASSR
jgi:hypothetical protein